MRPFPGVTGFCAFMLDNAAQCAVCRQPMLRYLKCMLLGELPPSINALYPC